MRRLLYWYVPLGAALIAAAVFAKGFYSFATGDTGTSVNASAPSRVAAAAPRSGTIVPLILGDSLARGTGDESGLGIGGRLVEELRRRKIDTKNIVNLAINGSRTADLLRQMESHNVQVVLAESNVIIVSIGGNDLWGDNFRNAPPSDPQAVIGGVIDHIEKIVKAVRAVNPRARIYIIGLYNPFSTTPYGRILAPLVNDWNAKLVERFAKDPNLVVVQTADLFTWRDRLSLDRFHPGSEGYVLIARRIADTF
jgi:lysophospholipase L1-like esterase